MLKVRSLHQFIALLNLIISHRIETRASRFQGVAAIQKHKEWLKALGNAMEEERLNRVEEAMQIDERRRKFSETQSSLRKIIREQVHGGRVNRDCSNGDTNVHSTNGGTFNMSREELEKLLSTTNKSLKEAIMDTLPEKSFDKSEKSKEYPKKKKKKSKRPVWSMSEEEREKHENNEIEELLKFAGELDFDQCECMSVCACVCVK